MKIFNYLFFILLFISAQNFSQEKKKDSATINHLKEVIVINKAGLNNKNSVRPLASIDEYLENSVKITMIKRGAYAWEPAINNMVSDRLSVTIDGMQIFGACTDKMDPITSYVDVSNVCEVHVKSGQDGSENGATIGGGIDLKLQKSNFINEPLNVGIDLGYESNSNAKSTSAEVNFSNKKMFVNSDVIFRKSDNYVAGGGKEVLFSQYQKYNISTVVGLKTSKKGALIGALIYDEANDVGYPALTMDVSLAKAVIGSVSYQHNFGGEFLSEWETKAYINSITHVMDDTKRPDVPIHMDMPGWSDTYGFYSKLKMTKSAHQLLFNVNSYYNKSLAEMTMYPADPTENLMFMLTWPDVRTWYSGFYAEDAIQLNPFDELKMSGRVGFQTADIADDFGLNSLKIFYPEMDAQKGRVMMNFASQFKHKFQNFEVLGGVGYGERAPSVTEAYGFYLFNSFDNYDYIGNPYLKNEKSLEFNTALNYVSKKATVGIEASYFHISNYIIGEVAPNFDRMTIGADGVKVFTALNDATIFNASISSIYTISKNINLSGKVGYSLGEDNESNNLPLISPISYGMSLFYKKNLFDAVLEMEGAGKQHQFSAAYGEDKTNNYTIFNASASYHIMFGDQKMYVRVGVDNVFDTYYSTFADWKNIPRMGRNLFLNISYLIK